MLSINSLYIATILCLIQGSLNSTCQVPRCLVCSDSFDSCINCQIGFVKTSIGSCVEIPVLNCKTQSSDNRCIDCDDGYFMSPTGCSRQNVEGCLIYFPNVNVCKKFKNQAILGRRLQTINNCAIYDTTTGACQTCKNLFYLQNNACLAVTISFCALNVVSQNYCSTCITNYYALNGLCALQSISNCKTYVFNQNVCNACISTKYILFQGQCPLNANASCSNYNSVTNICLLCYNLFYLSNGFCTAITDTKCQTNFLNSNSCQTCKSGYYPDLNNKCVIQNVPACVQYQFNTNICVLCENIEYLTLGICQPISDPFCVSSDGINNQCLICNTLFYLANSVCTPITDLNCIVNIQNQNQCQFCNSGFYVDSSSTCQSQNVNGCLSYNANINYCSNCLPTFALQDGLCFSSSIIQCASFDQNNNCVLCNNLFYLNNQTCVGISDQFCSNSDGIKNACQTCWPGYSIKNPLTYCTNSWCIPGVNFLNFANCKLASQSCDTSVSPNPSNCQQCKQGLSGLYSFYGIIYSTISSVPNMFFTCGECNKFALLTQNLSFTNAVAPYKCLNGQSLLACSRLQTSTGFQNPLFTQSSCINISGNNGSGTTLYLVMPSGQLQDSSPVWSTTQPDPSQLCWQKYSGPDVIKIGNVFQGIYVCDKFSKYCFGTSKTLVAQQSIDLSNVTATLAVFCTQ